MSAITRKQAEKALAAVREQFKHYILDGDPGPQLFEKTWGFLGPAYDWAIVWEEGPDEWALRCPEGGYDDELSHLAGQRMETAPAASWPKAVFGEVACSFALSLHPA